MLQILILWFLDGLLFDGINVNLGQRATNGGSRTRYIDSITSNFFPGRAEIHVDSSI